jgi:adenylate kinase family enzyme
VKRILIIGSGGAGKTTFAKALASRTGLPLTHLDQLFWHPGWVPTPDEEWDRIVAELIARDSWIMDGNYGRTLPGRLEAADTVIFLDLPRLVCMSRIFKRRLRNFGRIRPDSAPGCPERISWEFVRWVWTYRSRRRPGIMKRLDALRSTKRIIILKSDREVRQFLENVASS